MKFRILGCLALASTLLLSGLASAAAPSFDSTDPLVGVDRNRNAIIADIVRSFQGDFAVASQGAIADEGEKLRARLAKLRADRLLAASLASSYSTLKAILDDSEKLAAPATVAGSARAKALGDANKDLVYTPMSPCRLVDTRGFGAPIQGGPFAPNERRSYAPAGNCGIPVSGVAAMMVTFTTQNLTPTTGGYLAILAPLAAVTTTVDIFNLGQEWSASNVTVITGTAGQFDVFVAQASPQVVIDILGYFAAPVGGGGSVTPGPGLTLSGGTMGLATTQLLPTVACAMDQIAKWNGTAWTCAALVSGGGTVTNIATGAGLTGGPITGTGTIGLAAAQAMPTCTANQFPKWSGAAWICGDSPSFSSYGGFISAIAPTAGLYVFAGPTTGSVAVVPATRFTALATAAIGLTSGAAQFAQVGICMQMLPSGPVTLAGSGSSFSTISVTTARSSVTAANSFNGLAAGNYRFGMCVLHSGPTSIDNNDFLTGWVMLAS